MKNKQTNKMSWEALVIGSIFSLIFLLTFRLALALEPQGKEVKFPEGGDEEDEAARCESEYDCDGDGLEKGCDLDDDNYFVDEPDNGTDGKGCDVETDPYGKEGAGDGFADTSCVFYLQNDDGSIDFRGTWEKEHYSRNACDNCPKVWNPEQRDSDGDGLGNLCDPDPETPNPLGTNFRGYRDNDNEDEENSDGTN